MVGGVGGGVVVGAVVGADGAVVGGTFGWGTPEMGRHGTAPAVVQVCAGSAPAAAAPPLRAISSTAESINAPTVSMPTTTGLPRAAINGRVLKHDSCDPNFAITAVGAARIDRIDIGALSSIVGIRRTAIWSTIVLGPVPLRAPGAIESARTSMRWMPSAGLAGATAAASVVGFLALRLRRVTATAFDLEVDAETASVRDRVRAADTRLHHDTIANALTAIEGAVLLLESETATASDREWLEAVLASEFEQLRHVLSEDEDSAGGPICLAEVAARLSDEQAWSERLQLDVAPNLMATGSAGQTTEAVRQLLTYVSQRTPVNPITVRGERVADRSVLWVEVRTPGLSGWRRRAVDGSEGRPWRATQMELCTASRLVRGQGGQLRIENRPGGGASFGLSLPMARAVYP